MNDTPKIQGLQSDVKIRCVAVRTAYSYISPADYDEKMAKSFEKVADENIKDGFLRRPDILQAFARLVCEGYVSQRPVMPECVRKETDECFEEEDEETKMCRPCLEMKPRSVECDNVRPIVYIAGWFITQSNQTKI